MFLRLPRATCSSGTNRVPYSTLGYPFFDGARLSFTFDQNGPNQTDESYGYLRRIDLRTRAVSDAPIPQLTRTGPGAPFGMASLPDGQYAWSSVVSGTRASILRNKLMFGAPVVATSATSSPYQPIP